jgi:branched-chain amino acid aminotransferase
MVTIDWTKAEGWEAPKIQPYGPIELATSATVLHYGISAYASLGVCENAKTHKLQAFRVEHHLEQFVKASEHLDLPTFDIKELAQVLQKFAVMEKSWLDKYNEPDHLFIRMNQISTDKTLGVRTPQNTKIIAICTPVLVHTNDRPLALKCSTDVKRNWPLGHGRYRLAGNYGPILPSITDAKDNGFDDVLWLLDDYVKEMTNMNVFVLQQSRYGNLELLTPPDDGCIHNGVMRKSVLELAPELKKRFNVDTVERQFSIQELINSNKEGRLLEMFGTSISTTIRQVQRVCYRDTTLILNEHTGGKFSKAIYEMIFGIMSGDSSHPWVTKFE